LVDFNFKLSSIKRIFQCWRFRTSPTLW